jgi:hypothetical protein
MKAKTSTMLSVAALALVSSAAFAAPPSTSTMGQPNTMGKNSTANAALQTPRGHRGLGTKRANPAGKTTAPSNAVPAMCSFSALDTNGDGMIERNEAKANQNLYRNFKKWDRNGDGKIERSEWHRMQVKLGSPKYPGRVTNTNPCKGLKTGHSSTTGNTSTMGHTSTTGNMSSMGHTSTMGQGHR